MCQAAMVFLLGLVLIAVSGVFFWAGQNLTYGYHWAEQICSQSQLLCSQPYWLLFAGGALMVLSVIKRAFRP